MSLFAAFDPDDHGEEAPAVVRPAGPTDLDACAAITAQREGGTTSTWRGVLERRWARPDQLVLVAECDGEVAAYASATHLTPTSEGGRGAPDGWYLTGVLVAPHRRRRGLGRRLTLARIALLRDRADRVWYVASSHNEASLLLHAELGFREVARGVSIPGITFTGGTGVLSVLDRARDRDDARSGVGEPGDGGGGAADGMDRGVRDDAVEEGVPAPDRGLVGGARWGRAHGVPPVGDVTPAGGGERAADMLHRE